MIRLLEATLAQPSETRAFIHGEAVPAAAGATFPTFDPSTGKVLANVAACEEVDVQRAVASARRAFDAGTWSRAPVAERKRVLMRLADLIEQHAEELVLLDAINAGKPVTAGTTVDLPEATATLRWYAEASDKVFGKISTTTEANLGLIRREPVGVVGVVLPWNFPLVTLAWKLAPALVTGNSVVVKPPEQAPLSTLVVARLAVEAGLPEGVLNVVPGRGAAAGRAVGMSEGIDAVSFTGSEAVGRQFLRYAADSNLKAVTLECGGKNPQVVMPDAASNLDHVVEQLAMAAFWNSGQNCTAGSRILIHRDVLDEVVAGLVAHMTLWQVGSATDPDTVMGPLIERRALVRVEQAVESAVATGANVVAGGRVVLAETGGWFYEATLLDSVDWTSRVAQDELFGPIACVLPFSTEEEAVEIANGTSYGLAASVYTRDLDTAHRLTGRIQAGTVSVNCYSEGDASTPFGGFKASGFGGHDKGMEALDQYTRLKTTWFSLNA